MTTRLARLRVAVYLIASLVGVLTATPALAYVYSTHWTSEDPIGGDPVPNDVNDPGAGWNWPNGPWEGTVPATVNDLTITGTVPDGITIAPGRERKFGLDNCFLDPERIKTFTFEFDYTGGDPGVPIANGDMYGFGYHPTRDTGPIPPLSSGPVESWTDLGGGRHHYKAVITMKPQPDWEWLRILNRAGMGAAGTMGPPMDSSSDTLTMTNVSMQSVCTPEPTSLALLLLGTLITRRRLV